MRKLLRPNMFEPTVKRITVLALLLSLIAQLILVWTGFSYLNKNSQVIQANEKQGFQSFYGQNLTTIITEINNTMDLFEKNDLRKYSASFLPLRDMDTIRKATEELNEKLNALNLSPSFYKTVYLIGADRNQYSFMKEIGEPDLHVLPDLNKEGFDSQGWTNALFENKRKIVRFGQDELPVNNQALMNDDMKDFISQTSGNLVINNGNIGIFVIFVLQDGLFNAAEEARGDAHTPVVVSDDVGQPIWSSIADPDLVFQTATVSSGRISQGNETYVAVRNKLDLFPYQVTYLYAANNLNPSVLRVAVIFIAIAAIAQVLSFGFSFVRSKKMFLPFRKFSMAVRRQSLSDDMNLNSVAADLTKSGAREMSLKNKILITLIISVLVPTLASGLLYSFMLTQSINNTADQFLGRIGGLTKTSAHINVQRLENTINRLTISQELQEFLTKQHSWLNIPYYKDREIDYDSIAAFPGVNNFSYIVLYDNKGLAIYSSIFSNNLNLFTVNKSLFKDTDSSYWVSDYVDITSQFNAAIVKRIPHLNKALDTGQSYYLLAVPKDDLFKNMDFGSSGFFVTNGQNKELFHIHRYSSNYQSKLFSYSYPIADTGMTANFQYPKEEFEAQYREYFYRFLFVLLGVSLFSFLLASMLSTLLSRPIERLMGSINHTSQVHFDHLVQGGSKSEVGQLIENYNEMVQKMNNLIHENIRILEENAQSKLKEKEMNTLKVKAELDMLQSQINPHFLYNTLESINMKSIRYGMHDVSIMIRHLSDMFRYSVGKGSVMVPLQKEIDHVKNFIAIHNMRLGHIVDLMIEVPEPLMNASVLRFSLQPIVENSMKHAFVGYKEGACILIRARSDEQFLHIEIRDNGIGMDEERLAEVEAVLNGTDDGLNAQEGSGGIGLKNVYSRLKLHFPDNPGFRIESELMGGTTIRLSLPLL
ncbi:sensor histidine kinase [Paenibacillus prosopidis]|uniref:histidine kinase n=1 Tax=Paenibacillus prosopidis TaxID=630520 RepID=A0A368W319_9BACL|nr:sensor histidine kinase [Paenibacillus prosopidis]RCW49548.1 sensor histidine kinase YesM [Paenibacillus prosopidis]